MILQCFCLSSGLSLVPVGLLAKLGKSSLQADTVPDCRGFPASLSVQLLPSRSQCCPINPFQPGFNHTSASYPISGSPTGQNPNLLTSNVILLVQRLVYLQAHSLSLLLFLMLSCLCGSPDTWCLLPSLLPLLPVPSDFPYSRLLHHLLQCFGLPPQLKLDGPTLYSMLSQHFTHVFKL